MVKGKYVNEKARAAYKEDEKKVKPKAEGPLSKYKEEEFKKITPDIEKKSNFTNVKVGLDEIKDDMTKMMDKIDAIESCLRILANRLNRVDGMGNIKNDL